jgi:arogenate dehydrogenase (NADP+)
MNFNNIFIIGYGQFGSFFHFLLSKKYLDKNFYIYDPKYNDKFDSPDLNKVEISPRNHLVTFEEGVKSADLIIIAVPMRTFERTINELSSIIKPHQTVLEVCSVNVFPKKIMLDKLPEEVNIVGSHPMFGPNTYEKLGNTVSGLNLVLENIRCEASKYNQIKGIARDLKLQLSEMPAEEHDKLAAKFQFITIFNGLVLADLNIKRTAIDTGSAKMMLDYIDMVSGNETLLNDMFKFNPYCKQNLLDLKRSFENLYGQFI